MSVPLEVGRTRYMHIITANSKGDLLGIQSLAQLRVYLRKKAPFQYVLCSWEYGDVLEKQRPKYTIVQSADKVGTRA